MKTTHTGTRAQVPDASLVKEEMIVAVAQRGIQLAGTLTLPKIANRVIDMRASLRELGDHAAVDASRR